MSDRKRGLRGLGYTYTRQKGGTVYIAFTHEGKLYRESSGSTRVGDATNLLKDRIRQMRDGTFAPGSARVRLRDLRDLVVSDFEKNGKRSLVRIKGLFSHLERVLGPDAPARSLGVKLDSYVAQRKKEEAANATVNRELSALRRAFKLALQRKMLTMMPHFGLLAEPAARSHFPEPEEVGRILVSLPKRLREPMRFLSLTGWRVSEALTLQWRHVDFREQVIRLPAGETKGGEPRVFPFSVFPELKTLLSARKGETEAWERERGEIVPWVFWRRVRGRDKRVRIEPNRAYARAWADATVEAKCAHIHVHDLRRYVARRLVRARVPESVAMKLLGHQTRSVFERYNIVDDRDLKAGVQALAHSIRQRRAKAR